MDTNNFQRLFIQHRFARCKIYFSTVLREARKAIMFNEILVALKFSPASLFALEQGVRMARIFGANLHVFHAMDYRLQELAQTDPKIIEHRQEVNRKFETELRPLFSDLTDISFEFFPADPALQVCRIAKTIRADLIILGCHQPLRKVSLGRID